MVPENSPQDDSTGCDIIEHDRNAEEGCVLQELIMWCSDTVQGEKSLNAESNKRMLRHVPDGLLPKQPAGGTGRIRFQWIFRNHGDIVREHDEAGKNRIVPEAHEDRDQQKDPENQESLFYMRPVHDQAVDHEKDQHKQGCEESPKGVVQDQLHGGGNAAGCLENLQELIFLIYIQERRYQEGDHDIVAIMVGVEKDSGIIAGAKALRVKIGNVCSPFIEHSQNM